MSSSCVLLSSFFVVCHVRSAVFVVLGAASPRIEHTAGDKISNMKMDLTMALQIPTVKLLTKAKAKHYSKRKNKTRQHLPCMSPYDFTGSSRYSIITRSRERMNFKICASSSSDQSNLSLQTYLIIIPLHHSLSSNHSYCHRCRTTTTTLMHRMATHRKSFTMASQ